MIAPNITEQDTPSAGAMCLVPFRMPKALRLKLKKHLLSTGERSFQDFALAAVTEKLAAERSNRKPKGDANA